MYILNTNPDRIPLPFRVRCVSQRPPSGAHRLTSPHHLCSKSQVSFNGIRVLPPRTCRHCCSQTKFPLLGGLFLDVNGVRRRSRRIAYHCTLFIHQCVSRSFPTHTSVPRAIGTTAEVSTCRGIIVSLRRGSISPVSLGWGRRTAVRGAIVRAIRGWRGRTRRTAVRGATRRRTQWWCVTLGYGAQRVFPT